MKLRARLLVTALLAAIPAAILLYWANESLRARDMRLMLDRFVKSQLTDDARERCEANPNWFLAGPRPDRPSPQQLAAPDADVLAPRAPTQELPFEFFAYDDGFLPLSTAGPRFPTEFRQALKSGSKVTVGPFVTSAGTGQQEAVLTGWFGSPCVALLFRMRPVPYQSTERGLMFLSLAILLFGVAMIAGAPIVSRLRKLGLEARHSASEEYRSGVTVDGRDEMSALAFAFNEAAADIRRRAADVKDREDSLRRYIASTSENVTTPLTALERRLAAIDRSDAPAGMQAEIAAALADAHSLAMRLQNLSVAATLRMTMDSPAVDTVDLGALIQRVIERQTGFARAAGVKVDFVPASGPIVALADAALLEQAVNNLVDNAIRYNRAGGQVVIALDRTHDGRFSLRVSDDGPGAPDDVIAKLNANRRFRGDEGRTQRPGDLGLGLAIVREVADRFRIQWAFRRSAKGWFEAELTGTQVAGSK
jgi:signal transduction histidine kinase